MVICYSSKKKLKLTIQSLHYFIVDTIYPHFTDGKSGACSCVEQLGLKVEELVSGRAAIKLVCPTLTIKFPPPMIPTLISRDPLAKSAS